MVGLNASLGVKKGYLGKVTSTMSHNGRQEVSQLIRIMTGRIKVNLDRE